MTQTTGLLLEGVKLSSKHNRSALEQVIMPINIGNSHWILATLDIKEGLIKLHDSLRGAHPAIHSNLKSWAMSLWPQTTWSVASALTERQTNSDCGIHTMMAALHGALRFASPPPILSAISCRNLVLQSLCTGVLQMKASRVRDIRPTQPQATVPAAAPPQEQSKTLPNKPVDPFLELYTNDELCNRYCAIMARLFKEESFDWDTTNDSILAAGDMLKWCNQQDALELPPLLWKPRNNHELHHVKGNGFRLASTQFGPRGLRAGYAQLEEVILTDPSALHLQDIKVPRNKVAKVRRYLQSTYPLYTAYFNVSEKLNGPSLCTMIRNEYTPGLTRLHTKETLDGRLLCITIQGFGAGFCSTLINTYQHVNTPANIPSATALLEAVYDVLKKAHMKNHNAIWTGDLHAVLSPAQRWNYSTGTSLDLGDSLLQRMTTKMGATNTLGGNCPTWRSKLGEQTATLDHILVFPPNLRVEKGGCFFLKDSRFDHAVRWIDVNGNDLGFHMAPDPTSMPFKPQIQRRNWLASKQVVSTLMAWEQPKLAHLFPPVTTNPSETSLTGSSSDSGGSSPVTPSTPSSTSPHTPEAPVVEQGDISELNHLLSDIHVNCWSSLHTTLA